MRLSPKTPLVPSAHFGLIVLALIAILMGVVVGGCSSGARPRVAAPVAVTTRQVSIGGQLQLDSPVSGVTNTALVWTVVSGGGSFSPTVPGLFTAPATSGITVVRATLRSDSHVSNDGTIRILPTLTVSPSVAGTFPGLTVNLGGTLNGEVGALSWAVVGGTPNGTLVNITGNSAQYVAPLTPGTYTVTASTSDGAVSQVITLVVQPRTGSAAAVIISPASVSAQVGDAAIQFSADVPGATTNTVTWSASVGLISPKGGLYTIPDVPGDYTVTAVSDQNPALTASATVHITARPVVPVPPQPLVVSPNPAGNVIVGGTLAFSASQAVAFTSVGGTISQSGLFTAPATPGLVTVTATAVNPAVAPVTVSINVVAATTPPPPPPTVLTVQPNPAGDLAANGTLAFSANVAVEWTSSAGTISKSGLFTAPGTAGVVTVTGKPTDASIVPVSVSVNVLPPPPPPPPATFAVAPNPAPDTTVDGTLQFSASRPVTWTIEDAGTGASIDANTGLFIAPSTVPGTPDQTITVKATAADAGFVPVLVKVKILPRGIGGGTIGIN